MWNSSDLSRRPRPGSEPLRPQKADGSNMRTFTVTVVEQLSNSLYALCWHDPTLCNYEEQIWAPCAAPMSGHCALSGIHVNRGDPVYRPRIRGRVVPLNRDAMILATEMVKAYASA
jgi:Domain of unknown function (DUF3331)